VTTGTGRSDVVAFTQKVPSRTANLDLRQAQFPLRDRYFPTPSPESPKDHATAGLEAKSMASCSDHDTGHRLENQHPLFIRKSRDPTMKSLMMRSKVMAGLTVLMCVLQLGSVTTAAAAGEYCGDAER
jgi:hypothetical protein